MRAAGQNQASLFLFCAQAWPINLRADFTADKGADAGAAGAVSAGTGRVDEGFFSCLQDGLPHICGKLQVFRHDGDSESVRLCCHVVIQHGLSSRCKLATQFFNFVIFSRIPHVYLYVRRFRTCFQANVGRVE